MKRKLGIGLLVIVVIIALAFIALKIMTKNAERNVETEKAISINAGVLIEEFLDSESTANSKYLNKTLEVKGIITNIDSNEQGYPVLLLNQQNGVGVSCTFKKQITGVVKGNWITIKGICTGILSNITLDECILLKVEPLNMGQPNKLIITANDTLIKKDTLPALVKTFTTTKAQVKLDAGSGLEDIKAVNNQVEATISSAGMITFRLPILGFKFPDALMQQHFNEDYMESAQYPTASFKGRILKPETINFEKDGRYKFNVTGNLLLHGITKKITIPAYMEILKGKPRASTEINLNLEDFKIKTDVANTVKLEIKANF